MEDRWLKIEGLVKKMRNYNAIHPLDNATEVEYENVRVDYLKAKRRAKTCQSNPCQHGGTCRDALNNHTSCTKGYSGRNCEVTTTTTSAYANYLTPDAIVTSVLKATKVAIV